MTDRLEELRRRAESALQRGETQLPELPSAVQGDFNRLMEELHIYQAELELQNQELMHSRAQADHAHRYYATLFNQLPLPALVVDSQGVIQEANVAAYEQLDLSPSAQYRPYSLFRLLSNAQDQRLAEILTALHSPAVKPPQGMQVTLRNAKGSLTPFGLYGYRLHEDWGDCDQAVVLLIDRSVEHRLAEREQHLNDLLNAHQQTEAELLQAKLAAEAANVAKSRFLATMSHELRTPMNGILGMAQLLLSGTHSPAQTQDCARTILQSGQTLLTLLNDILDLSKIEAGKLTLESGRVDLAALLHETHALFSSPAQDKRLQLTVDTAPFHPSGYRGDAHRLKQMLNNLMSNALKFTTEGGIQLQARVVESQEQHDLLEFAVTDTGMGISSEHQALLFQPFTQVDDSSTRRFSGTGLGLSIVRNLAQAMGGEVGVDSTFGHGSRFWFRVPLKRNKTDSGRASVPALGTASTAAVTCVSRLTGRVLLVDDHEMNQAVMTTLLHDRGVSVVTAMNGQLGVERFMAEAEQIDAILMDVHMPVLDGYGATAQIREWEQAQHREPVPIIALTASAFSADRERCLNSGMNAYLTKPVDLEHLTSTLAQYLPHTSTDPATPPTIAPMRAADWAEFQAQVQALLPLLAQSKFDALECFTALETRFAATPLAEPLAALRPQIQAFRFTAVAEGLHQMASQPPDAVDPE